MLHFCNDLSHLDLRARDYLRRFREGSFARLRASSWFLPASTLAVAFKPEVSICEINSRSGCSCALSAVQQCYDTAEYRLFLVAVFLHSCLLTAARNLVASQQAGTAAHLLRLVGERTEVLGAVTAVLFRYRC